MLEVVEAAPLTSTAGNPAAFYYVSTTSVNTCPFGGNCAGNETHGIDHGFMNTTGTGALSTEAVQQIVVLSFFMFIALTGNVSVLIYLCRTQGAQRPVSIFVMSLAITDTLIALLSMSIEILFEAFGGEWLFGNIGCKVSTYVQCMLFASTAFILMSMSYDRFEAICRPMFLSRTLSRSRRMIIYSWIIAAVIAIPQVFIFLEYPSDQKPQKIQCRSKGYTDEWQRKLYLTWLAIYLFIIPLIFVAVCYIKIAKVVWKNSNTSDKPSANGNGIVIRRTAAAAGSADRAKFKTIKITVCILSCYIFCWTPYFSVVLFNAWTDNQYKGKIPTLMTLSRCMAWCSSCVNPIIYASFNIPMKSLTSICCPSRALRMQGDMVRFTNSPRPSNALPSSRRDTTVSLAPNTKELRPVTNIITPSPDKLRKLLNDVKAHEVDPRTLLIMI